VTSSVVTDLVSAAAVVALPILDGLVGLEVGWFALVGIIGSLGDVRAMTAREALLPGIARNSSISTERLVRLRGSLAGISLLIGPAALQDRDERQSRPTGQANGPSPRQAQRCCGCSP
jgi:hypothetical protein